MSRRALCVGISSMIVAVGLAACTASHPKPAASPSPVTVPAATWAHDVCSAVKPWSAHIADAVRQSRAKIAAGSDPVATKADLVTLFMGARKASDDALATVERAGIPRAAEGAAVAEEFAAALRAARDNFANAAHSVQQLSTTDRAAFFAGVVKIGTQLSTDSQASAAALAQVDSPELEKAFTAERACG